MQSPGTHRMDNGHGACVADEHVACTEQVVQELPVSHWSVTAHCTGGESLPTLYTSLSSPSFHWQQERCPTGYPFTVNSSDSSEPNSKGLKGALGAASVSPFKGQEIKIIKLYTYGYRPCKRTRSQASQGSLPTLSSS